MYLPLMAAPPAKQTSEVSNYGLIGISANFAKVSGMDRDIQQHAYLLTT